MLFRARISCGGNSSVARRKLAFVVVALLAAIRVPCAPGLLRLWPLLRSASDERFVSNCSSRQSMPLTSWRLLPASDALKSAQELRFVN